MPVRRGDEDPGRARGRGLPPNSQTPPRANEQASRAANRPPRAAAAPSIQYLHLIIHFDLTRSPSRGSQSRKTDGRTDRCAKYSGGRQVLSPSSSSRSLFPKLSQNSASHLKLVTVLVSPCIHPPMTCHRKITRFAADIDLQYRHGTCSSSSESRIIRIRLLTNDSRMAAKLSSSSLLECLLDAVFVCTRADPICKYCSSCHRLTALAALETVYLGAVATTRASLAESYCTRYILAKGKRQRLYVRHQRTNWGEPEVGDPAPRTLHTETEQENIPRRGHRDSTTRPCRRHPYRRRHPPRAAV